MPKLVITPLATPQQVSRERTSICLPNISACICMRALFAVIPPSTIMFVILLNFSFFMLSHSRYVIESSSDLRMCCFVVLKFRPITPPCTSVFQNGENIVPNDGMKWRPQGQGSRLLSQSQLVRKPAFFAQLMVPPPHSTDIQKPYVLCPFCWNSTVVTKAESRMGQLPILVSRKQPVPQVIFIQVAVKLWAQAEDCWSPSMQHRGIPLSSSIVMGPTYQNEFIIFGKHYGVICAISSNCLSHCPVRISIRWVRLAFEASVTYFPVRNRATQVSIVPNRTFPSLVFCLRPSTFSSSHKILNRLKQVETGSPVFCTKLPCFYLNLSQTSLVRASHHTIALQSGLCVSASQHTTVYL